MKSRVVAIGIDGSNRSLLDQWLRAGKLPAIQSVIDEGVIGRHSHIKRYRNALCWELFLSGRTGEETGSRFDPASYDFYNLSFQREQQYSPFYALGNDHRVCIFDLPAPVSEDVCGIQVSGWGSELNAAIPVSRPPHLITELHNRHGKDPKLTASVKVLDYKTREAENSYVLPGFYDIEALNTFRENLLLSVERRTNICLDLLDRDSWDLFLALYPENHTANHTLWHLSQSHPAAIQTGADPLLEIMQATDTALGRILQRLTPRDTVLLFTIDHTTGNNMDVTGMALLPELIYRWDCNREALLFPGKAGEPVPPPRMDYRRHWKHEIWSLTTARGRELLESPSDQEAAGDPFSWNPANWYRPLWPDMKAFALPGIADGFVRLNVQGREAQGKISPEDFAATLADLGALLRDCRNPRTGRPLADRIITTRDDAFDSPDVAPDIIVCWDGGNSADCLDSPQLGRIGPLPYFRSGGHVAHGTPVENMLAAKGPGFAPGSTLPDGNLVDLPATILDLIGAEKPPGMEGKSLLTDYYCGPGDKPGQRQARSQ